MPDLLAPPCCPVGTRPDVEAISAALRLVGTPGAESLSKIGLRLGLAKSTLHKHRSVCLAQGTADASTPSPGAVLNDGGTIPERRGTKRRTIRAPFDVPNPGDDAQTAPRKVVLVNVERLCIDLRAAGKSYAEIAEATGIAEETAVDFVERILNRTRRGTDAKADMARRLDILRIDKMIASIWDRATDPSMAKVNVPADTESGVRAYDGQDKAIDRMTRLLERRAKLLGLDAPTSVSLTLLDRAADDVDFTELYRVIRKMLDARFPGATDFITEGLDHYRVRGEAGIDAFLAGDMAVPVQAEQGGPDADPSA